jgi:hypothetical protein
VRFGDSFDQGRERLTVGDVAGAVLALAAGGLDLVERRFQRIRRAADEDDVAAIGCEPLSDGAADSATGACDDGDALFDGEPP